MIYVIYNKNNKTCYSKFGEGFTKKLAKEFVASFGFKIIFCGSATERTMDMIYNNDALYLSGESLLYTPIDNCRYAEDHNL